MADPTAADIQQMLNGPEFVPLSTEAEELLITEDGYFIIISSTLRILNGHYPHEKRRTWTEPGTNYVRK